MRAQAVFLPHIKNLLASGKRRVRLASMFGIGPDGKKRCFGNKPNEGFYADYHDREWGVPLHDDTRLFEMLVLEGAQAGLSWATVLRKREGYRQAFHQFDIAKVAAMSDAALETLAHNPAIIRNRLKIASARRNARIVQAIQKEQGSLDAYLWAFVGGAPRRNRWTRFQQVPTRTEESDALAHDLKRRGMSFVGSTSMYAYMQSVGMVNDHLQGCWRYGA